MRRLIILNILVVLLFLLHFPSLSEKTPPFLPDLEKITDENITEIQEIARFGRGIIDFVSWSPDGSQIAVLTSAGVWIYDRWDMQNDPRYIPTIGMTAISPDWKYLASNDTSGNIRLWNLESGEALTGWKAHEARVTSLKFSHDSKLLVSQSQDVMVWNVATQEPVLNLTEKRYTRFIFSPDSGTLALSFNDDSNIPYPGYIHLVDLQSGELLEVGPHDSLIHAFDFTIDGKFLFAEGISSRTNENLKIWEVKTGQLVDSIDTGEGFRENLVFSPDGKTVAVGHRPLQIRDAETFAIIAEFDSYASGMGYGNQLTYSPDGRRIAFNGIGAQLKVWDLDSKTMLLDMPLDWGLPGQLAFNPQGDILQVLGEDNAVHLFDMSGQEVGYIAHDYFSNPRFVGTNTLIADGLPGLGGVLLGSVKDAIIWNLETGARRDVDFGSDVLSRGISYSAVYDIFLIDTNSNAEVVIWRSDNPPEFRNGWISAISPDGTLGAIAGRNLQLIDLYSGNVIFEWEIGFPTSQGLRFNHDSTRLYLLTGSNVYDIISNITIFDTRTGVIRRVIPYNEYIDTYIVDSEEQFIVAFSPNFSSLYLTYIPTGGRVTINDGILSGAAAISTASGRVISSIVDGRLVVWNINEHSSYIPENQALSRFYNNDWVRHMELIPDTHLLVYNPTRENYAVIWNINTETEITRLYGHSRSYHRVRDLGVINHLRVRPDGKLIVTSANDGTIRLWGVPSN